MQVLLFSTKADQITPYMSCVLAPGPGLQAVSALASERAASIVASSKEAGQQLAGAVQQLQGSQQSIAAAAGDSHKADTALASQLASAAGKIGEETTGRAWRQGLLSCSACLLAWVLSHMPVSQ